MHYNRILSAYDDTFNKSGSGIQVMADLEEHCYANGSTFVSGDALETAFREGMRSVYLMIKDKAYRGEHGIFLDENPQSEGYEGDPGYDIEENK